MTNKIPETLAERMKLRQMIAEYAEEVQIVPPVAMHTLRSLVSEFIAKNNIDVTYEDWLMVELHNAIWMPTVASIPYDRRLLLIPKCLSKHDECEGEIDELGLLCHRCGRCVIPSLQDRAEKLGVLSMVAEGFTSVVELIENNVVDAVIGVSCLESLEKAFPLLVSHAVPGLAVPLNYGGCKDTQVDTEYLCSMLPQHKEQEIKLLDYYKIKDKVAQWFTTDNLKNVWNPQDNVDKIAFDCLAGDGKRWRPFLLAAVYQALTGAESLPVHVRYAALAVECFHKASLVHDDIQDKDQERYGKPTVNAQYGDAIAINIGDLLLGQGYKFLTECKQNAMVGDIANAHIRLCKGQGMELNWTANPSDINLDFVLEIFANKTAPAFEVSLTLALICAEQGGSPLRDILCEYSRALGIAYQLNDDICDYTSDNVDAYRPSAPLALHTEHPELKKEDVLKEMERLAEEYHISALNALGKIDNLELKRLLFQVTEKVLKRK